MLSKNGSSVTPDSIINRYGLLDNCAYWGDKRKAQPFLQRIERLKIYIYSRFEKEKTGNSTLKMQLLKLGTEEWNVTGSKIY